MMYTRGQKESDIELVSILAISISTRVDKKIWWVIGTATIAWVGNGRIPFRDR